MGPGGGLSNTVAFRPGHPPGLLMVTVGPAGPVTVPTGREGGLTQEFYSGPVSMPRGY